MRKLIFYLFCFIQGCSSHNSSEKELDNNLSADSLFSLGCIYFDSEDYFDSWKVFSFAKMKDSSNCKINYHLGISSVMVASLFENDIMHNEADSLLRLAFLCDSVPSDLVYEWLGLNQLLLKNYNKAQDYFLKAIEIDSTVSWYYINLASCISGIDSSNYKEQCPFIKKALVLGDSSRIDFYNQYCR